MRWLMFLTQERVARPDVNWRDFAVARCVRKYFMKQDKFKKQIVASQI